MYFDLCSLKNGCFDLYPSFTDCSFFLSTLSCHIYEGHTDQNAPLLGKYILSSISESHGSPKTNLTTLKEKAPKNI